MTKPISDKLTARLSLSAQERQEEPVSEKICFIFVAPILIFLSGIYSGFALTVLWKWFIVSAFGVSELSLLHGCGVYLTLNWLAKSRPSADKDKGCARILAEGAFTALLGPSFVLGLGWLYLRILG